jgi:tetratricopeptide (TPR) repeat protein
MLSDDIKTEGSPLLQEEYGGDLPTGHARVARAKNGLAMNSRMANSMRRLRSFNTYSTPILDQSRCRSNKVDRVADVRRAVELAPSSADVADLACFVLAPSGYSEEAAAHAERAMVLNPNYPAVYLGNLGNAYRLAGRTEQAIAAFKTYRPSLHRQCSAGRLAAHALDREHSFGR